jgi:ankyrin repeat protein
MDQRLIRILGGTTEHYPYALENKYPRILETIMSLWDEDEIDSYFMELMVSDREGRGGFPPDVAANIMRLSLLHAAQEKPDKIKDIWDASATSFVNFKPQPLSEWINPTDALIGALQKINLPCTPAAFFEAVETGNRTAAALFIDAKINTEIRDNRGWTPLMAAAFRGQAEIVDLLIRHGAEINALDSGGNSALHWAAFGGHADCARQLIAHSASIDLRNHFGWTPLIQAAARNHTEVVSQLISSGVNLDTCANDGYTALHKAAELGYGEIAQLLLVQGANPDLANSEGNTPLKLAIKNKQDEVVKLLTPVPNNPA